MSRLASLSRLCTSVTLPLVLAGCAAQWAYRDGKQLVDAGRVPEGLQRLEEASRHAPGVAEYRVTLLQTRERYVDQLIAQGEVLRRQGLLQEAEQAFRQVLGVFSRNDRAVAGLRAIDQQRRHDVWLVEAQVAVAKKELDTARTRIKAILLENSSHAGARELQQKLEEASAPPAESALAASYRKPITIEFKDATLRTVFEVISRTSGLNFLFDKDIRTDQKTSIFLKNSTIENAVLLTLLTNQLEQRVLNDNTILIYPNTQAKQKDYQALTVKSFYLANADAKTVAGTLKTLLKTRDVVIDEKLNLLILRDSPEAIRLAEKLVAVHDVPEPEVMLEVEILEVKRTRLLDLGVRWPDQLSLTPIGSGASGAVTVTDLRNLNGTTTAAGIGPLSVMAKKTDSDANILANPRIRARNREKAKILIGERVPNITTTSTSTGFAAESINYVDVGLKLEVEPTIYLDSEVAIKISLEVSSIISQVQTKSGSVAFRIGTRSAQTVLRLKDGENQVLAGLINDEDRRSANKVPVLGEVPVLGRLFGDQTDDTSKTEIVLSITPRVVRNVRQPAPTSIEFESGTENSLGVKFVGTPAAANAPALSGPRTGDATGGTAPVAALAATTTTAGGGTAAAATSAPGAAAAAGASSTHPPAAGNANAPETPATPAPTTLRWQGPAEAKVGDNVAMQLLMQSGQPIVSVPLAVGFDPRLLQVTSVQEGDFLRQGGAQTSFASRVDPSGQVLITGTRSGEGGASAEGIFATVHFRVAAATSPEARVQLLTVAPVALGGRSVTTPPAAPQVLRIVN